MPEKRVVNRNAWLLKMLQENVVLLSRIGSDQLAISSGHCTADSNCRISISAFWCVKSSRKIRFGVRIRQCLTCAADSSRHIPQLHCIKLIRDFPKLLSNLYTVGCPAEKR